MTPEVTGLGVDDLGDIGIGEPKSDGTVNQDAKDGKLTARRRQAHRAMDATRQGARILHRLLRPGIRRTPTTSAPRPAAGVLDGRQAADGTDVAAGTDRRSTIACRDRGAPEGAVRGHGERAARRRSRPGSPASSPLSQLAWGSRRGSAPTTSIPSSLRPEVPLTAYAANPTRRLQAAERPHRHARPARRDALRRRLRFLVQGADAMRAEDQLGCRGRCAAPRPSSTSCTRPSTRTRAARSPAGSRASTSSASGS